MPARATCEKTPVPSNEEKTICPVTILQQRKKRGGDGRLREKPSEFLRRHPFYTRNAIAGKVMHGLSVSASKGRWKATFFSEEENAPIGSGRKLRETAPGPFLISPLER